MVTQLKHSCNLAVRPSALNLNLKSPAMWGKGQGIHAMYLEKRNELHETRDKISLVDPPWLINFNLRSAAQIKKTFSITLSTIESNRDKKKKKKDHRHYQSLLSIILCQLHEFYFFISIYLEPNPWMSCLKRCTHKIYNTENDRMIWLR